MAVIKPASDVGYDIKIFPSYAHQADADTVRPYILMLLQFPATLPASHLGCNTHMHSANDRKESVYSKAGCIYMAHLVAFTSATVFLAAPLLFRSVCYTPHAAATDERFL